jgi:tetratricopeptide (TPR) repeat protein
VAQLRTPEETKNELTRFQAERAVFVKEIERLRQSLNAATSVPSNPPPAVVPEQGSPLFRKIEQENADLRQQLARTREAAQMAEKARSGMTARDAEQRARVEKLSAEINALKKELDQSKAREEAVQRALDKIARKSYQQQEDIEGLEKDLARCETERDQSRRAAKTPTVANPADTAGLLQAARRALRSGRAAEAEKLYVEALAQTPSDALIHYNLGVIYSDYLKNPGKAVVHFRRYLELNPLARDASRVRSWMVELEMRAAK